jgi:L-ascorbate metabolism protein UlaG (beta-lactamase superfamily)
VIESQNRVIYFAGDTAFGDHFHEIRKEFGPPRLSLVPIGAYEPRWFMSPVHMDPAEALKAHEILGSTTSVAIHHGTFQLGDEAIDTPAQCLKAMPCPKSFLILRNGESAAIA